VTALNLPGLCIDGECQDEALFHQLEDYINNLQQDGVIVLHTIGSHGPTYYNRYPAAFRKFTPTCDTSQIQTCTQEQLVNTYDNTILYVDYIVDKAIKLLQSNRINSPPAWFIFPTMVNRWVKTVSIYTVCLIPSRKRKNIPMLIWLSEIIKALWRDNQCLQKEAQQKLFAG
jgi:lipid A ethanolaminephosphotransferase